MGKYLKCDIKEFTNVFHIADCHIRLTKRHDEYKDVFSKLYKAIEKTPKETVVAILGDLLHSKSDLSPECVKISTEFLQNIADRRPTVLIAGNHDATLANKSRLDSITPIVDALNHQNLHYLKDSGVYILGDILFNNYSVFDDVSAYTPVSKIPKIYINQTKYKIGLYHGSVHEAVTDVGYKVTNNIIKNELFDGHDIVLLGDIHRHQVLQHYDGNSKPVIVFAGSLVQQNHGEELKGHGFVYWDLKTKAFKHFEISNEYGFYTVEINKGKLTTDISDIPSKVRLRVKCNETIASEVKTVLSYIKQHTHIEEVNYIRVDDSHHSASIAQSLNYDINQINNIDYQNKLISQYILNIKSDIDKSILENVCKINTELNNTLQKEHSVKNIRWKPKKFEFDNMFSYGENNVIDFSQMKDVVGLFASNASGKSSILSALSFCIFDKCDRAFKASHVLNTQKMGFKCKFNFEINGVDFFIEREGKSDKKGNVKVDVKFYKKENNTTYELNGEARRSTNDIIRDYVGTYEDFILTVLSIQNSKFGSFVDMGQTERKDLLSQFMGLNIFDVLYTFSLEKTKELNAILKIHKNTDYTIKLKELDSQINSLNSQIEVTNKNLNELNDKKDVLNNNLLEETKKYKSFDDEGIDLNVYLTQQLSLNKIISDTEKDLSIKKSEEEKIDLNIKNCEEKIQELQSINILSLYKEYFQLKEELNGVEVLLDRKKLIVNNKLQKLKTLEQHEYDPNCEYCVNNVFVKDAIKTKNELIEDHKDTKLLIEQKNNIVITIKKYENVEEKYNEYNQLNNKLKDLINLKNKVKNSILQLENKISTDVLKLKTVNEKIELFNSKKDIIEQNKIVKNNIETIKNSIKFLENSIKLTHSKLIELNSNLSINTQSKQSTNQLILDIKKLEVQYESYELYTKAIGRDGIPYELITKAIPTIEKEVNNILNQIVEFTVSLNTDGKNVSTYINYDEKKWPLELASGLEKFISSLAIRVALINISNLPRPNFIAIDEGWGVMDANNLSSVSSLFSFLKTNFDFIFVISHMDVMRDMVDSHLEIQKINGFSKVQYL